MTRLMTAALAVLLGVAVDAAAQSDTEAMTDVPGAGEPVFVSPPAEPTEVAIGLYLVGLTGVSSPDSAFPTVEVEMFMDLRWTDERLAFEPDGLRRHVYEERQAELELDRIWWPDIEIENEVGWRETQALELIILPDGTVEYLERFRATVHAELDPRRFPLDTQTFDLLLESFEWNVSEVRLVPQEAMIGFDRAYETPEWSLEGIDWRIEPRPEVRAQQPFSSFVFQIHATRHAGHYILRFMMPLLFVMGLTWCALWMPVEDRFEVGFVTLLAVVAFHALITDQLPRLSYPTFVDYLLTVCYVFTTVLIGESIWVRGIDAAEIARVRVIERRTRWMLPAGAGTALLIGTAVLWM